MALVEASGRGGPPQGPAIHGHRREGIVTQAVEPVGGEPSRQPSKDDYPVCPRCGGHGVLGYRPVLNRQTAAEAAEQIQKLRNLGIQLKISQKEIAEALHVPVATIANWETRHRVPRDRSEVERYRRKLREMARGRI